MRTTPGIARARIGPPATPPAVKALLIANIGIYALDQLAGWNAASTFGLIPNQVFAQGKVFQLFTYMFLHGGILHLLFNMFMLWIFGSALESVWGSREFLKYYAVCGIGGGVTQVAVSWGSGSPIIGASGAIMGILLAYAMMYPDREILLYFLFPIKMKYLVIVLVMIDLMAAFGSGGSSIAHFAHLGGMFWGWVYLKQSDRIGSFSRHWRGMRARHQMDQNTRRQEAQQTEKHTVDEILDKITAQGMGSLTEKERKILREASRH